MRDDIKNIIERRAARAQASSSTEDKHNKGDDSDSTPSDVSRESYAGLCSSKTNYDFTLQYELARDIDVNPATLSI